MLVGEQPGDKEDLAGHPFVGPAGRILDEALDAAGILKSEVYITNVVKHFNWAPNERGKRRIHKKAAVFGDSGLPPLARRRDRGCAATDHCLSGGNRGASFVGQNLQRHSPAGRVPEVEPSTLFDGHGTPFFHLAGSRRVIATRTKAGVHQRSRTCGGRTSQTFKSRLS